MSKAVEPVELSDAQRAIFESIGKNDMNGFKQAMGQLVGGPNFLDENGMTPLQHACCKGNKEAVQILLDMGADIHFSKHGADYTPLHFAALSGNIEVCRLLLDAGINPNSLNSVSRTASQMAAFVGNHACVEAINNYVPRSVLEYYTKPQGQQTEALIPPAKLDAFHSFVVEPNLHPVRIALNVQTHGLIKEMTGMRKALQIMCDKEMKKTSGANEVMAFKFHYLAWILGEMIRCEEQCKSQRKEKNENDNKDTATAAGGGGGGGGGEGGASKSDFIETFIKRVLKENKNGQLDYVEFTIRDCVRDFTDCTVFRQAVQQLAAKEPLPALAIIRNAINGQRGFMDEISYCSSCGNEKPDKKCSKCKVVQYCDRECQRLHWFMHKKNCARLHSAPANANNNAQSNAAAAPIDSSELHQELAKLRTAS